MYLRSLEICVLKKTKVKLDLLTDSDMSLMVTKVSEEDNKRRIIFHSIFRYAKSNNKYMKDLDKKKELSYI